MSTVVPRRRMSAMIPNVVSTSAGDSPSDGSSNTMRPRVGASRPETARSVDVLPAPLAPITQTSSPGYTTRSRPRRTATGPYAAWRSSRLSNGARSDTAIDGPQVGADDVRVRLDRGGRALRDHAAVVQHDHGVRDGHDHPHIVLDQEDGGALVTDSPDQVGHRRLLGGGHAGAGLVEEEEPGPGAERHRELHEPLLPVRELARPLGAAMAEAHEVDDPVGVPAEPRFLGGEAAAPEDHVEKARRSPEVETGHDIVGDGQRGEDARALERADDPAGGDGRGPEPRQQATVVLDPSARGGEVPRDRVEGGRLSGAVRSDYARDRAGVDVEGHAGERRDAAEAHGQVADGQGHDARRLRRAIMAGTTPRGRKTTSRTSRTP